MIVIGCNGFIGRHFCRACPQALGLDRSQVDLTNPQLPVSVEGYRYALIAGGVSNPRICEKDPVTSYRINVEGPLKLGKELLKKGVLPIFFSTDYVLNDHLELSPLNIYGQQKRELEREAEKLDALVVRLSKVYGIEKGDGTLFDEMARELVLGKEIRAARDQVFAPVFVGDVVQRVLYLLERGVRGVVSVVGPHFGTRLEMATRLAKRLGAPQHLVIEISLDDLKDGVCRPKQLALSGDFAAMHWEEGMERVVNNYAQ